MKKNVCLIYSWENFKANYLEKDVGLFPWYFSKSSCENLDMIIFDSTNIEEEIDGELYKSKNFICFSFDFIKEHFSYLKSVKFFILFHISLRTALLGKVLKLINPSCILIVKSDLSLSNVNDFSVMKKKNKIKYWLISLCNNSIDAFCIETSQSKIAMMKEHDRLVNKKRIFHVPNGVLNNKIFSETVAKEPYTLTIITRDDCDLKGIDRIIPLFECLDVGLSSQGKKLSVKIIGQLSSATKNKLVTHAMGYYNLHVDLLGVLSKDETLLNLCKSDIFVNLSLEESYCFALVEAALAKCYIITTPVGVSMDLSTHYSKIDILNYSSKGFAKKILLNIDSVGDSKCKQELPIDSIYEWGNIVDDFYKELLGGEK